MASCNSCSESILPMKVPVEQCHHRGTCRLPSTCLLGPPVTVPWWPWFFHQGSRFKFNIHPWIAKCKKDTTSGNVWLFMAKSSNNKQLFPWYFFYIYIYKVYISKHTYGKSPLSMDKSPFSMSKPPCSMCKLPKLPFSMDKATISMVRRRKSLRTSASLGSARLRKVLQILAPSISRRWRFLAVA